MQIDPDHNYKGYDVTITMTPRPDRHGQTQGRVHTITGHMKRDQDFMLTTHHDHGFLLDAEVMVRLEGFEARQSD